MSESTEEINAGRSSLRFVIGQLRTENAELREQLAAAEHACVKYAAERDEGDAAVAALREQLAEVKLENEQLRYWKESAIAITPDWQEIGELLGVGLGESIADKVVPGIKRLLAERDDARRELTELKQWAVLRSCQEEIDAGNGPCGGCVECLKREIAMQAECIESGTDQICELTAQRSELRFANERLQRELADERAKREAAEGVVVINGEKYRAV